MIKMEQIQNLLQSQFPFLLQTDIEILLKIATLKSYKNKQSILRVGQIPNIIGFIFTGMIRGYHIDGEGEEKTVFLRPTHTFFSTPETIQGMQPSKYAYEAIGEAVVLEFSFSAFEQLTFTNLAIARLFTEGLKETVLTLVFRVEMLAGKTPEERYDALLKQYPQFFQKAYNKYIANYLGITPNSLSRIIKRKKEGKGKDK
jgi:CRP-like cAMP-binding protein